MNRLFKKFFLFISLFFFTFLSAHANSSKIYNKEYLNPINVLNSFLWSDDRGGYIGLSSKTKITNRNLSNTIHPVSIDSFKVKLAFSKLRYKNLDKGDIHHIFNNDNLEILSKNITKGLKIANNLHDVIFQLVHNNDKEYILTTKGIVFVEKNSLNLIFFTIHECEIILKSKKKKSFYRRSQIFPKKNPRCKNNKKKVLASSDSGIYKKNTGSGLNWLIFTPRSWQIN